MGSKKMNPIKINPYRPILRQLILGDLSSNICKQYEWTISPYRIGSRQKTRYRPIFKTVINNNERIVLANLVCVDCLILFVFSIPSMWKIYWWVKRGFIVFSDGVFLLLFAYICLRWELHTLFFFDGVCIMMGVISYIFDILQKVFSCLNKQQ